jgi:hypothetical protein
MVHAVLNLLTEQGFKKPLSKLRANSPDFPVCHASLSNNRGSNALHQSGDVVYVALDAMESRPGRNCSDIDLFE